MPADRIEQGLRAIEVRETLGQVDAPVCAASCDMVVKMVVPTFGSLLVIIEGFPALHPALTAARESPRIAHRRP
jgi:hypothetical protein